MMAKKWLIRLMTGRCFGSRLAEKVGVTGVTDVRAYADNITRPQARVLFCYYLKSIIRLRMDATMILLSK